MRAQRGFTLIEVAIAASISLAVILTLFSAVHQAGQQTVYVDKKRDERNLLSDLRFILANPVLCKDRVDLSNEFSKGEEVQVALQNGMPIGKGIDVPIYGERVDSLKVIDSVQISEDRSYDPPPGCQGARAERLETQKGYLMRVNPDQDAHTCFTNLIATHKIYYVDLEIQTSSLGQKQLHFRPERLARLEVVRDWTYKKGKKEGCQSQSVVRVDANNVTPVDFKMRAGHDTSPGFFSNLAGLAGWGGPEAPPAAPLRTPAPSSAAVAPPSSAAAASSEIPAAEPAPVETARAPASLVSKPAAAPAPAASPHAPSMAGACAINMSAEDAIAKGLPVVRHGGRLDFPLENCMEKRYLCWEGALVDLGLPVHKRNDCGSVAHLTGEEMARQLTVRAADADKPLPECAVNTTVEEAHQKGWATFKSGEHAFFDSGLCEQREFVCFGGRLMDTGHEPVKKTDCAPTAKN
ncbi:MAG: PulJ/GspJ family protein [Bdellovibrionota bacterium]